MLMTDSQGTAELREAVAQQQFDDFGVQLDPARLVICVGAKEGIVVSLLATLEPGDEVLVPDPGWVTYEPAVELAGGVSVHYPLSPQAHFRPNFDAIAARLTPRTRMIIVTSPHNPTGVVFRKDEAERLAELAEANDLLVMWDESNAKVVYDDITYFSFAALPGMTERTLLVGALSKNYAMAGWRVGYLAVPALLFDPIVAIHQHTVSCVPAFIQRAACVMLTHPSTPEFVSGMVHDYAAKRELFVNGLTQIPGLRCHKPEGTFNSFPNVASLEPSSIDFSRFLLHKAGVASVPGAVFGGFGEGYVRMAFTLPTATLEEALELIEKAVRAHT
jgi:aspartate/methionine/tyrosine aminotransferase